MGMLWERRWETLPLREYFDLPYDTAKRLRIFPEPFLCFWDHSVLAGQELRRKNTGAIVITG